METADNDEKDDNVENGDVGTAARDIARDA